MADGTEPEPGEGAAVDPELIEKWALAYLERFASSAENLRRVLLRRVRRRLGPGASVPEALADAIDVLVARYRGAGLLDDQAYAAARLRAKLRRGRSLQSIRAGLAAKGVSPQDVKAALETLDPAVASELAAAGAFARRRRLGPFRAGPADAAARARELGAFARAGFGRRAAEAVLACADADAVAALLADEAS